MARPLYLALYGDEAWRLHEQFRHLHLEVLHKLGKEAMARGLPVMNHVEQLYDISVTTKQKRCSFPCQALYRA